MLRKIRIAFAIFFFVLITLLFLDFTGTLHAWFGWMAKVQFLPALLALNVGVVVFLIALTFDIQDVYTVRLYVRLCIPRCRYRGWPEKEKRIGFVTPRHWSGYDMECWQYLLLHLLQESARL